MRLAELQRFFAEAATSGAGPRADLERVFVSDAQLSASERLAIYNRGYYYRLLDALGAVFEQTQRAMGRVEFERIALSYVARHPSEHPAVERIGRCFPQYLRELSSVTGTLADLAALEWARLTALLAPSPDQVLSISQIEPREFPRSRLRFVATLQQLELDARALTVFSGGDLDRSCAGAAVERCTVAVWRPQHHVLHERLETLEAKALRLATEGASLSRICACFDSGAEAEDEDAQRAFQVFARWFARRWLESVDLLGA